VLRASGECTYTLYAGAHYEQHGRVTSVEGDPPLEVCDAQQTSYFSAGGQAVALRSTYPYEEAPFQWEMTSTVHYLHRDRLGSLTEVTDKDKNVVGRARYDAYGHILSNTIPLTLTTRLYAWSDYDPATGLYKIGARWYDPQLGVWLTPDSVVPDVNNPKAWNPYAFNYQNPVQYVDPSGHIPIWDILDIGFFASSLVSFVAAPGLGTGFDLLLDTIDLLPGVTGLGWGDEVASGRKLLPAGEPISLANQPGRLLPAGESPISFYHGTSKMNLSSFRSEGVLTLGGGDFGVGFYATRQRSEGIWWAHFKSRRASPIVIELQVQANKFDELIGKVGDPYSYKDSLEEFIGLAKQPYKGHSGLPFDYVFGKVSGGRNLSSFRQFTFKSRRSIDLLDASPMLVYQVLPNDSLKLIERIVR
jgi:RHS repeat-associated protein